MPTPSEVLQTGGVLGVILIFFVMPGIYLLHKARVEVWQKREIKKIDSFDVTISTLNEAKLDLRQQLSHTEVERDSYAELAKARWTVIEDKEKDIKELNATIADKDAKIKNYGLELEAANANTRRAEGDLQQANSWSAQLAGRYERRIARYRKFIREGK